MLLTIHVWCTWLYKCVPDALIYASYNTYSACEFATEVVDRSAYTLFPGICAGAAAVKLLLQTAKLFEQTQGRCLWIRPCPCGCFKKHIDLHAMCMHVMLICMYLIRKLLCCWWNGRGGTGNDLYGNNVLMKPENSWWFPPFYLLLCEFIW